MVGFGFADAVSVNAAVARDIRQRDLGQVLAHVHDQAIETGQGPEPPAVDRSFGAARMVIR